MAKRKSGGRHKHYFTVRVGKRPVRFGVWATDAKQEVVLTRTAEDVLAGTEGMSVTCANALCALRSEGVFPHDAFLVSFTRNRCYVVDKVNRAGVPTHCVRYAHREGTWQTKFDKVGKKALIAEGEADRTFVLSVPPKHTPVKVHVRDGSRGNTNRSGQNINVKMRRGEVARLVDAGINIPGLSTKSSD